MTTAKPSRLHVAIDGIDGALAGLALVTCFLIVLFAVASRFFFNFSYLWTDEAARYLIIWSAYFGASAAVRTGQHTRVELGLRILGPRLQRALETGGLLLCAAFTSTLTYSGYLYASESKTFGLVSTESDLPVPLWIVHLAVPAAFALMTARLLAAAWTVAAVHADLDASARPVPSASN